MSKTPHLVRRFNTLYFRISVPPRFRSFLGISEITQTLDTQDYKTAVPLVYKLASEAKTIFNRIDKLMEEKDIDDLELLREVVESIEKAESVVEPVKKSKSGLSVKAFVTIERQRFANQFKIEELEAKHEAELKQASTRHKQALLEKEIEILRSNQSNNAGNASVTQQTKVKQPRTQQRPEAFHSVRMDFAETVIVFIAGIFPAEWLTVLYPRGINVGNPKRHW